MATRNNVTRLLDARNIPYQAFPLPPEKRGALETARMLGVSPDIVFKTIVVQPANRGKPILALIPAELQADLKKIARAVGEKKVTLPTQREAERLTGLQAGGISPLALLHRGFQVLIDETAQLFDEIHISGGERGLNIRLPVAALAELCAARFADISS